MLVRNHTPTHQPGPRILRRSAHGPTWSCTNVLAAAATARGAGRRNARARRSTIEGAGLEGRVGVPRRTEPVLFQTTAGCGLPPESGVGQHVEPIPKGSANAWSIGAGRTLQAKSANGTEPDVRGGEAM